jgi:hypothetical protein
MTFKSHISKACRELYKYLHSVESVLTNVDSCLKLEPMIAALWDCWRWRRWRRSWQFPIPRRPHDCNQSETKGDKPTRIRMPVIPDPDNSFLNIDMDVEKTGTQKLRSLIFVF